MKDKLVGKDTMKTVANVAKSLKGVIIPVLGVVLSYHDFRFTERG